MKGLTWDVGILAALGILLAYSLLIRRHKSLATLVSVYIAYFIAAAWGDKFSQFLTGDRVIFNELWLKTNATPYAVQGVLLIIFTFLISTFLKLGGKRSRYAVVEIVSYSVCTIAVGLMFIMLFMPDDVRQAILATSKILPFVYRWRDWIMIVPVVAIIYFGIFGEEEF